jgi:RNA polymerase sigma factor (sigma-70 family)
MSNGPTTFLLHQVQRLAAEQGTPEGPDRELVWRFAHLRDEGAFEALLRRHGPMVLRVCRRVLHNEHDAADAFQATFLVLARKAGQLRRGEAVGNWLYGVARRTALKARGQARRRAAHEQGVEPTPTTDPLTELTVREAQELFDQALAGLPEKYRAPLVLCHLEGATRDEAARQLAIPLGTLKSRLERGRQLLGARLARRGLTLSTALLALGLGEGSARASLPPALLKATADAGKLFAAGETAVPGVLSRRILSLATGEIRPPFFTLLKLGMAAALALATVGLGLCFHQAQTDRPPRTQKAAPGFPIARTESAAPPRQREVGGKEPRTDRHGDPLPRGAIARLGTLRFRAGGDIEQVAFSPDGRLLVAADNEDAVTVWEAATGKQLRRLAGVTAGGQPGVAFSPDGKVLVAAHRGEIRRRDTATWDELPPFRLRACTAGRLLFSPDGKVLATVGTGPKRTRNVVVFLDAVNGRELHRLSGLEHYVAPSLAFAPDSRTCAYADRKSHEIHLYDTTTGRELRRLAGHQQAASAVAFSPAGKTLASTDLDGNLRFWAVTTGKLLPGVIPFRAREQLAYSPDGKLLAGGGYQKRPQLWDVAAGKQLEHLQEQRGGCSHVVFSSDGKRLASYSQQALYVWDVATGKTMQPLQGHEREVWSVAFSPDGRRLATAGGGWGQVRLWDAATGKELPAPEKVATYVYAAGYSPDGKLLAVGGGGREQGIWLLDAATGKQVRHLKAPRASINALAFSADGRVVAGKRKAGVEVWDVVTGKHLQSLPGATWTIAGSPVALSPDGRTVADTAGEDRAISLWDVATGKVIRRLPGHRSLVHAVAFSADGQRLASAGDKTVRLWDPASGRQLWQVEGDAYWVRSVAFSPDGRMLALGGRDGEVRLWEVATGKERTRYRGHRAPVICGTFSADGTRLATGSSDTTVLIWDVKGKPRARMNLSGEELAALWVDLFGADAASAYGAIRKMAAAPAQSVPFLKQRLRPVLPADPHRIAQLLANLDSNRFTVREKASRELEQLGARAMPALRKALEGKPSAEARRHLERLLAKAEAIPLSERRAVEVLERMDTPAARKLLRDLSQGVQQAWLTREARAALARLAR